MQFYEITFIVRQEISSSEVETLLGEYADLITEKGGNVLKREYWGLRSFSYPINKNKKGHYIFLGVEASPELVKELQEKVRYSQDIVRDSIIKVDSISSEDSAPMQDKFSYTNPWHKSAPYTVKASIKRQAEDEKLALELDDEVNEKTGETKESSVKEDI